MRLVQWRPLHEMVTLRDAMDRMEDNLVRSMADWPETTGSGLPISVDMYEKDNKIIVETDLPGVKPDDVDISINGSTLTIKGEFKSEEKKEDEDVHILERRSGKFQRSVALPENIDADEAEAVFDNGVLKLTLGKTEQTQPKKITVKSKA